MVAVFFIHDLQIILITSPSSITWWNPWIQEWDGGARKIASAVSAMKCPEVIDAWPGTQQRKTGFPWLIVKDEGLLAWPD
jgi:hypothetical protein